MNYIDTHFHLDLWDDPSKLIPLIEEKKIYTVAVTNLPSLYYYTEQLSKKSKYINPALGFHPELIESRENEFNFFMKYLTNTKFVGEIGLDYSGTNQNSKKIQIKIFEKIIDTCANYNDKVLTIHSRGASADIIEIIGDSFPGKVIFHWYSGSVRDLQKALNFGYYFSVNLGMTFSQNGSKIISKIPLNRILTESDGPFISHNNEKCSPLCIKKLVKRLSSIFNMSINEFSDIIFNNYTRIVKPNT